MDTHVPDHRRPTAQPRNLPTISDYWPDAPQPRAALGADDPAQPHPPLDLSVRGLGGPPRLPVDLAQPRRGRLRPALGLTVAVLLLTGTAVAGIWLERRPASRSDTATAPPAFIPPAPPAEPTRSAPTVNTHVLSAPADGRVTSTFELLSSADNVNLRTAALGADLYRISTPKGGGVLPQIKTGGAGVRLLLVRADKRRTATVDIVLNARVRWSLTMTGGVRTGVLNLSGGTVTRVDLIGGATRMDLTLPRPNGTTGVRMSGGANQFRIRTPGAIPIRARIRQGAGKVVFNGRTDNGVARNAIFVSPDFADSNDRIDVDAVAGVGTLTVGR